MMSFSSYSEYYLNSSELPEESIFAGGPFDWPYMRMRRQILRETIQHFKNNFETIHTQALCNLKKWQSEEAFGIEKTENTFVEVHSGDWGDVTAMLTKNSVTVLLY